MCPHCIRNKAKNNNKTNKRQQIKQAKERNILVNECSNLDVLINSPLSLHVQSMEAQACTTTGNGLRERM